MADEPIKAVTKELDIDLIGEWINKTDLNGELALTRKDLHLIVLAFTNTINTCRNLLSTIAMSENTNLTLADFREMNSHFVDAYDRVSELISNVAKRDLEKVAEEKHDG